MKKGSTMALASRQKMVKTKGLRKERERIGREVIVLLVNGHTRRAQRLAREKLPMFIVEA